MILNAVVRDLCASEQNSAELMRACVRERTGAPGRRA
jgi:hypothetical protein